MDAARPLILAGSRLHERPAGELWAVGIAGGLIQAVGRPADVRAALPGAEVVDLRGAAVLPGFVDSHLHVLNWGRGRLGVPCWPSDVASVAEIRARVLEAAGRPGAGPCIRGRGYDPGRLAERRAPTAADLDIPGGVMVALDSMDFHRRVVNSAVLRAAAIGPSTPDPPGGAIVRDAGGDPTGELVDSARSLVEGVIPPWSDGENDEAVRLASEHFLSQGVTRLTNAAPLTMSSPGEEIATFARLAASGGLRVRVRSMVRAELAPAVESLGLPPGLRAGRLEIAGFKVFADGAFGPRTAWVSEPYEDGAGGGSPAAVDLLETAVRKAAGLGWQVCVHAVGDLAVAAAAASLARATPAGTALRHRIEHCCLTGPETVALMARSGTVPVPQPGFLRERAPDFARALGEARMERLYPLRDWIDAGLIPLYGSDAPVVQDTRPLVALASAVTRKDASGRTWGADQAVTREEAIQMLTRWPAIADGDPARGLVAPGQVADLTVLERDPRQVPPESWAGLGVVMTVVDGAVEWVA